MNKNLTSGRISMLLSETEFPKGAIRNYLKIVESIAKNCQTVQHNASIKACRKLVNISVNCLKEIMDAAETNCMMNWMTGKLRKVVEWIKYKYHVEERLNVALFVVCVACFTWM